MYAVRNEGYETIVRRSINRRVRIKAEGLERKG
jgi:hypothetical protein